MMTPLKTTIPAEYKTTIEGEELMTMTMSQIAEAALTKVLALRRVTFETNTVTRRSQNQVLQTLGENDMIAVSTALAEHQQKHGW